MIKNMSARIRSDKLPYVFDLLWDLKTVSKAHDLLVNEDAMHCTTVNEIELVCLMKAEGVPLPENYEDPTKDHEPYIWADSNGGYLIYEPDPSEAHLYKKYRMT